MHSIRGTCVAFVLGFGAIYLHDLVPDGYNAVAAGAYVAFIVGVTYPRPPKKRSEPTFRKLVKVPEKDKDQDNVYPSQEILNEIGAEIGGLKEDGDPYYTIADKNMTIVLDYSREPQRFRNALMLPVVGIGGEQVVFSSVLYLPWGTAAELAHLLWHDLNEAKDRGMRMDATYQTEVDIIHGPDCPRGPHSH